MKKRHATRQPFAFLRVIPLMLLGLSLTAMSQEADFMAPEEPQFVPGQVIVKYAAGISAEATNQIEQSLQLARLETLDFVGAQVLQIPADRSVLDLVAELSQVPGVEFAEPNYIVHAIRRPNDPQYPQQ